jgi:riboflavin kinase/FMN adenylyltransferase
MRMLLGLSLHQFKKNKNVPSVITIGNFDGIHLGHQVLINRAKKQAREQGDLPCYVMTFDPHPRQLFGQKDFKPLMSLRNKLEVLEQMGVNGVYLLHFTPTFSQLSAEEFIKQYLVPLNPATVIVGSDFAFGYKGLGNVDTLKEVGEGHFSVEAVNLVHDHQLRISSTRIRGLILDGRIDEVSQLLGRNYSINGQIQCLKKMNGNDDYYIHVNHIIPQSGRYRINIENEYNNTNTFAQIINEKNLRINPDIREDLKVGEGTQVKITFTTNFPFQSNSIHEKKSECAQSINLGILNLRR